MAMKMDPATARQKREDLLRDGFCIIDNILPPAFVEELRAEADRLNDTMPHAPGGTKYQGTHLGIRFDDHPDLAALEDELSEGPHGFSAHRGNPVMKKLAEWPASRVAVEAMGLGDFQRGGSMIVLTKEPAGKRASEPLYWHHVRVPLPLGIAEPSPTAAAD
jgi:hypothetical protein